MTGTRRENSERNFVKRLTGLIKFSSGNFGSEKISFKFA